jgi:hypothetical protein
MRATYEPPSLAPAGRFADVTRGRWGWGHGYFYRRFRWGHAAWGDGWDGGCGCGGRWGGGFGGGGFVVGRFFF